VFVASRVDYCGSLLIDAPPKKTTDKLQCTCPRRYSKSCIQQRQVRLRAESVVARQASLVVAIFNSVVVAYVNDRAKFRSQDPLDRFSQSLHHMVGTELQMINPTFFSRYLKGRCHGNQFCDKPVLSQFKLVLPRYRPRSRGDNTFGSVRPSVCL